MAALSRCKIIIIGDPEVGKTTLFNRILFNEFINTERNGRSTLGLDCFEKTFEVLGEAVRVELHDTPKKERFRTNSQVGLSNLYRCSDAVILVYDVEDVYSFESLMKWVRECQEYTWGYTGHQLVWAVVGSKSDMSSDHEVSFETVDAFLHEINTTLWFEVSGKTGEKVDEMFQKVLEEVYYRKLKSNDRRDDIKLSENVSTYEETKCICTV